MRRERRKYKRLDAKKIEVMWRKDNSLDNLNKMGNVSEGGFRLVIGDDEIKPGETIQIEFKLPTGETIYSKGRVIWIRVFDKQDSKDKGSLEAGIEFIDITAKDKEAIKKFIISSRKK